MSGEEPFELPGLAALRGGPSAAVCANGHVFAWFVDPGAAPKYCAKCGAAILTACPACKATLPADAEMLQWVPYHEYCMSCGNAYPWIADEISRAKRTLAELAENENWSDALKARADGLVDDIVADRAVASEVVVGLTWLGRHAGESATETVLDAVDRLGSATLKQALRPNFPGRF